MNCNLRLSPKDSLDDEAVKRAAAETLRINIKEIEDLVVNRRSIDTRRSRPVIDMAVTVYGHGEKAEPYLVTEYPNVAKGKRVIVVGSGPAGLFASLRLIEKGFCPIVLERGENVHDRKRSMAQIVRERFVNPESNYSFGEGGAGAFSDGKLYTRSVKRGDVKKVLNQLCQHGASLDILSDSHPHIGTDKLPLVVENIRNTILEKGGEVHFNTRVDNLLFKGTEVVGAVTADGREFQGPVILATGHSARDLYRYLDGAGVSLEAKGIAVGVRLEHPQFLIDTIQYKNPKGRGEYLPAASYSFVTQAEGRGVYSFCMCPGGFIIPASTENGQCVVNGMSPSKRNGKYANAAMVVELRPEDVNAEGNALSVMNYQEALERKCFVAGGSDFTAPAQRMADFVSGHMSKTLQETTYGPGVKSANLSEVLPSFVSERLRLAFSTFGRQARGFLSNDALMIATESRTSSPVRIVRDNETFESVSTPGLFPAGEGAGYAGGIVSAALDGINVADAVIQKYN
jgi:Uncharacterized FAD-dependent dehydrogenases